MLTEIDGKWLDLAQVVAIRENGPAYCKVWLRGDPASMDLAISADKMAAMVNDAQAKAQVSFSVGGHVNAKTAAELKATADGRAESVPPMVPYHQGQQDGLRAARLQIRAALAGTDPDGTLDHITAWLDAHIADEPRKIFSKRPAFSPEQLEESKTAARADGFRLGLCYAVLQRDSLIRPGGNLELVDYYRAAFKEIETRVGATPESIAESIQEAIHWRMKHMAQEIASPDAVRLSDGLGGPKPPQTTPATTKPVTEAASASNVFLWAVAWVQDLLRHADGVDDLFPAEMTAWLVQQLESLETDHFARAKAMIKGHTLCDQREGDGDAKDCYSCNGTGEVQGEHSPEGCTCCNGTGLVQEGAD